MNRQMANRYRRHIEQAAVSLPDDDAYYTPELFPRWRAGVALKADARVCYGEKLYRVVQAHTTQDDWTPDITPALFTEVPKPGEIPVWKPPTGAHNAYAKGAKVHYPNKNGPIWESLIDVNTYEPGVYGWTEVE